MSLPRRPKDPRYNSRRWRKLSDQVLGKTPTQRRATRRCTWPGCRDYGQAADHIEPTYPGPGSPLPLAGYTSRRRISVPLKDADGLRNGRAAASVGSITVYGGRRSARFRCSRHSGPARTSEGTNHCQMRYAGRGSGIGQGWGSRWIATARRAMY